MRVLEDRRPEAAAGLTFPAAWVYAGLGLYVALATLIVVDWETRHTVLLDPVDPTFHALMSSIGFFGGVIFAAIIRDGWTLGLTLFAPIPGKIYAAVQRLVLVGASYFAGGYGADRWTEWRAFHGLTPLSRDEAFFVERRHRYRGAPWTLDLRDVSGALTFTIDCGLTRCVGVRARSWIRVSIETGRDGLRRASLPQQAETLRSPMLSPPDRESPAR